MEEVIINLLHQFERGVHEAYLRGMQIFISKLRDIDEHLTKNFIIRARRKIITQKARDVFFKMNQVFFRDPQFLISPKKSGASDLYSTLPFVRG